MSNASIWSSTLARECASLKVYLRTEHKIVLRIVLMTCYDCDVQRIVIDVHDLEVAVECRNGVVGAEKQSIGLNSFSST